ncbi:MAG: DNA polymerase IV [Lachnospiraceae bacterium]
MTEQLIFHVDINSAFLSFEAVHRLRHLGASLDLRQIPSIIGGDESQRHGIVLAKSIPAKRYGIRTGESVMEARKKCPSLYVAPAHYHLYSKASKAFVAMLRTFSPRVEQFSIDECWMDMSGCCHERSPYEQAVLIKNTIREILGFSVNIGISVNKLLAKMASDFTKPDRVHTLFPDEIRAKMWPLPVADLYFVGRATQQKLHTLGIRTIGELALTDPEVLHAHLKKHGETIWQFANGYTDSELCTQAPPNKGYGNSTTIAFDVTTVQEARMFLLSLSEMVGQRLRKDQMTVQVVSVSLRYADLSYQSRQMKLSNPTNSTNELYHYACQVFDALWNQAPIRQIGIHGAQALLDAAVRQSSLFDRIDYTKESRIDRAVDEIRKKFGERAVTRAVFLGGRVPPVSGGVSEERKTVDYSKIDLNAR